MDHDTIRAGVGGNRRGRYGRRDGRRRPGSAGLPLRRQGRPRRLFRSWPAVGCEGRPGEAPARQRHRGQHDPDRRAAGTGALPGYVVLVQLRRSLHAGRGIAQSSRGPVHNGERRKPGGRRTVGQDDRRAARPGTAGRGSHLRQGILREPVEQRARRRRLPEGAAAAPHGSRTRPYDRVGFRRRGRRQPASLAPSTRLRPIPGSSGDRSSPGPPREARWGSEQMRSSQAADSPI